MMELKVEIPEDLKIVAESLSRKELNEIVVRALKERSSESILFKYADEILKNSKITDELALKLGSELKDRVAKRHALAEG